MDPVLPSDADLVHLAVWAIVAVVSVAVPAFVALRTGRGPGRRDDPEVTFPTPDGTGSRVNLAGQPPELVAALASVSQSLGHVLDENRRHETRIGSLERTQAHFIDEVSVLRKGIANGTIPPLPPLREQLRPYFADLEDTSGNPT